MSDLPKGYLQAIDNLALYIRELTIESQEPILSHIPTHQLLELAENNIEFLERYCEQFYTPEQKEKWDKLDEIFEMIYIEYGIDPADTAMRLEARILQYDLESGELFK